MAKDERLEKYPNLNATFFRGSLEGQVNSVSKEKESKPGKVEDFRKAVADGVISLGDIPLKKSVATKLIQLGVTVPGHLLPAESAPDAPAAPIA